VFKEYDYYGSWKHAVVHAPRLSFDYKKWVLQAMKKVSMFCGLPYLIAICLFIYWNIY